MRRSPVLDRLDGPPFALNRMVDRLSERWWGLASRLRASILLGAVALGLLAVTTNAAAGPYGPPMQALVAVRDLDIGHQVSPDDLQRVTWPRDLLPEGAAREPAGRLSAPLPAGSVLTIGHFREGGMADLLDAGDAAVPIPAELLPPLAPGDRVDLIGRGIDGAATILAQTALVLAVDQETTWIATQRSRAAEVAAAAASGMITIVVLPA